MNTKLIKLGNKFINVSRDPRYVFMLIFSVLVFTICTAQVLSEGLFDSIERPVFEFFNQLPKSLYGFFYAVTQFGGLTAIIFWSAIGWYLVNRKTAILTAGAGFTGWTLAKVAKDIIGRGRPFEYFSEINIFEATSLGGLGYPSGHCTFAATSAAVLYYQVPRNYRKYLLLIVFLVGLSRMYLGVHFPLDVVGGWALGAGIGATFTLIFGVSKKHLRLSQLRKYLSHNGYDIKKVTYADVDARGSRPFFVDTKDGKQYFGKVFGREEHAADWLFKVFRFFRYKNLQGEELFLKPQRNIEMESLSMLWAHQAGVRTAKVSDVFDYYGSSWILVQEKIDSIPMSEHGNILQISLEDAWRQVQKLHDARIAHRDLRAANLLIDKQGKVWLIDFGFSKVSAPKQRLAMDVAELLASMSCCTTVERTVAAASKILTDDELREALPYLQKAVFSGETTKQLKNNPGLLSKLRMSIRNELGLTKNVEKAEVERFNLKSIFGFLAFGVFLYIIVPQVINFRDSFTAPDFKHMEWLILVVIASLMTYVFTGLIYVSLSPKPLNIVNSTLVQLASSFVSKILPGGMGGASMNMKYLTKAGLSKTESSAIVATQTISGFIMFAIPLLLFLFFQGENITELVDLPISVTAVSIVALVVLIVGAVLYSIVSVREYMFKHIRKFIDSVRDITASKREFTLANIFSFSVTVSYVACLYASFRLLGVDLGISEAIFVYASAVVAKSVVPTPGGLGPLEAAMIAVMISLGVDNGLAFSAMLVYRLATYWLPIPFSLLSYKYISTKGII